MALERRDLPQAETEYRLFQKRVDQAAAKRVIHPKNAARLKSRCESTLPHRTRRRMFAEARQTYSRSRMERIILSPSTGLRRDIGQASESSANAVVFSAWPSDHLLIVEIAALQNSYRQLLDRALGVADRLKLGGAKVYTLHPRRHPRAASERIAASSPSLDAATDALLGSYFEQTAADTQELRLAETQRGLVVVVETDAGDLRFTRSNVSDNKVLNAVLWITAATAAQAEEIAVEFRADPGSKEFRAQCRTAARELLDDVRQALDPNRQTE